MDTEDAPLGPVTRISAPPMTSIRWHESWIIRAAGLASFILFLGYASSAYFAFESIDHIARLAYDEEVERVLGDHLDGIKSQHELQQGLLAAKIEPKVPPLPLDEPGVRALLKGAGVDDAALANVKLTPDGGEVEARVEWLDRDTLRLPGWTAEFPRGATYEAFKAAEDVRQRYQLIGVKLDGQIRPTLIKATSVILVASFFLLASLFLIYAQRFKARIGEVLKGFSVWSEKDQGFRFVEDYKGELRLITGQFNAMADEVEANRQRSLYLEKIASWQIIARKLAHEIKNPLTPIQMMVSQLKRRYKGDDADFAKLLDNAQTIITEEVAGLRRMVDNFSNFARLPEPQPKPVDLVPVCARAAALEQNRFPHHKITFQSALASVQATVDEDLIRQVLLNLVKNAGEACGEKPSHIQVGLEESGEHVLITVTDDGPGIPAELQGRIFEAYFTTKHTGPNPGMGLGLAVCQKIVMDHAGRMAVKSRPGETVFTIRLPRRKRTE